MAGGLLVAIGVALSTGMGYLLVLVANAMHPSGRSGSTFTGTPRDGALIVAILGAVLVLGVTSTITGVWQVVVGRRSRLLTAIVLVLGALIVGLAVLVQLPGQ